MGREVDLLVNYPKPKRDLETRSEAKSDSDRATARKFGRDFFDGDRKHGYGGFSYNSRFWQPVIPTIQEHFALETTSRLLDVGCGKGFMMHDLAELIPGIYLKGIDISEYGIENSIESVRHKVQVADARSLPFEDDSFDVVISINTIHNLDREDCAMALKEIERVSRGDSFVTVDAFRNEHERERMEAWNLTARTIMSTDEWVEFFDESGYTGDYYWFIP